MPSMLGIFASAAATSDFELISSVTVGAGGVASVSFTSIPSTYKHLQVRGVLRPQEATNPPYNTFFRFNGDSGTNYSRHRLTGDGATATSGAATSQTYGEFPYHLGSSSLANAFAAMVIDVLDYASTTKNKTVRSLGGYDINGAGIVQLVSTAWLSTAAVSSLTVYTGTLGNLDQFSTFSLYGVK